MKLSANKGATLWRRFMPLRNDRGQSTVEYVAVLTAIFLIAGLGRSTVADLGDTIKQKYRSYCFSVAMSDPPLESYETGIGSDDAAAVMVNYEQMIRGIGMGTREDFVTAAVDPESAQAFMRDFVE